MKKVKICLAIHCLQAGGMERVMAELIEDFSKRKDVELNVILFGRTREIFYQIPQEVPIHKPEFPFDDRQRFLSTLRTIRFLRKTLKKLNPDTVLCFGEYWNNLVLISTLGLKIPVYVSDRSQPDKSLGKIQDLLRIKLYPGAAGVIAQTEKAASIYKKMYRPKKMAVIGNPIRQIDDSGVTRKNEILMVARLIRSKHQNQLIRIFAGLDAPKWNLVLVGDDHLKQHNRKNWEKLTEELSVKDRVLFAGKRADVDNYYQSAKIFAFTSSSEGFPNVIGEAMSAGLPIVAYDCVAGPSEMIEDGKNGFLIPLFDEHLFAEKLRFLINHEENRVAMGIKARTSIGQFSKLEIAEKFYQLITSY